MRILILDTDTVYSHFCFAKMGTNGRKTVTLESRACARDKESHGFVCLDNFSK